MNRIIRSAFAAAMALSLNPASASNGVLFSNTSDPYFETPEEFRSLARNNPRAIERGPNASIGQITGLGQTQATISRQNEPARGGHSGR